MLSRYSVGVVEVWLTGCRVTTHLRLLPESKVLIKMAGLAPLRSQVVSREGSFVEMRFDRPLAFIVLSDLVDAHPAGLEADA